MATVNVTLPASLNDWVEAQAHTGRYSSVSDYVRDLIERDQERAGKLQAVQRAITEGFESGVSDRSMAEILDDARAQANDAMNR